MSTPVRRGGRLVDDAGRTVVWSVAAGRRGRLWRWTVEDANGAALVVHALETDPDGRFVRLESASGTGLLTLHREPDGSAHGNRVTERGIDHLAIEAPAPELALVGSTALGCAALLVGIGARRAGASFDAIEVLDDLGVRVVACSVRRLEDGIWEVSSDGRVRRAAVDADGLPVGAGATWPLERGT